MEKNPAFSKKQIKSKTSEAGSSSKQEVTNPCSSPERMPSAFPVSLPQAGPSKKQSQKAVPGGTRRQDLRTQNRPVGECRQSGRSAVPSTSRPETVRGGAIRKNITLPSTVTVRRKTTDRTERIQEKGYNMVAIDLQSLKFGSPGNLSKGELCFWLPRDCCPFCCRQFQGVFDDVEIKCRCCNRKICSDCVAGQKLEFSVRMCPLCEERNDAKGIRKMIDDVFLL